MKNDPLKDKAECPFCHSLLTKSATQCIHCGAEMIDGYINSKQRQKMLRLRIVLLAASYTALYFLYQSEVSSLLLVVFYLFLSIGSWILPFTYFKFINRKNSVWKRKSFPW
ncbi:hypothetical protein LLS47_16670 [Rouxiella badensis]|uniref:hypothetical protein n=1 Tax=Rouxiella badensis TaxID=1646377 RepID=UPI001D14BBA4|nr:hypothetical protein [Rouxiella badensis]MCC3734569.1 hypothetical protein [Rouxiella badensis]MCC3742446.1 hypothetical protein [Rouxiella badensis]MCC3760042.1 hypothetical protein [Rouxiella badensis]